MKTRDLFRDDADWPTGLHDLGDAFFGRAPRVLGPLPDPARPGVAIVGSREASEAALHFARDLAGRLARQGVVVWSGGAKGVDRAAHEGAMLEGGVTVAVLGGGIGRPSPPCNADLFRTIVERGGALVSPYADEQPALRPGFLHRNKVLAAAAQGLVVVECDLKSGARSAAAAARALRRPVGVVPIAPWDTHGAGNRHELTRLGAAPIVDASDVLRLMDLPPPSGARGEEVPERRVSGPSAGAIAHVADPLAREIHALLATAPRQLDELVATTGRSSQEIARALFELAIEGVARELGPGTWTLG